MRHLRRYANRERGLPLFVSAVMYLDKEWPEENQAETLFMDIDSGYDGQASVYCISLRLSSYMFHI